MRCVTPMFRCYEVGNYKKGHIVPRQEVMQELQCEPNQISWYLDYFNKNNRWSRGSSTKYETIPCNHCWACRLNYSAEWATRIMYESMKYENNYFVTLTYDDDHLPIAEKITIGDKEWINTGEESWITGCLNEPDMHKFIHDLRQYLERKYNHTGLKYYYCGEYGETTHRAHYHIILMNCPLDISTFYDWFMDERYKLHWKVPLLDKLWGKGMIDCAELEWSSAAYVARYCMKKIGNDFKHEDYAEMGKLKEFVRMSRNIGREYYEQNKHEIYKHDELIMRTVKGNVGSFKPPKAWDKRFKEEFPDQWRTIKKSREQAAERSRQLEKQLSDYTDAQRLQMNYEKVVTKGKMLPRVGEW